METMAYHILDVFVYEENAIYINVTINYSFKLPFCISIGDICSSHSVTQIQKHLNIDYCLVPTSCHLPEDFKQLS